MKHLKHNGFTLIEIMIVTICTALLMGPVFFILKSSSNTSLTGMLRIDTTLEARRVIKQIHSDLKQSCFPVPYGSTYSFDDNLGEGGTPPLNACVFYSFPLHSKLNNVFTSRTSGKSIRKAAEITYRIETHKDSKKPSYKLIREEKHNGKTRTSVLSNRVNYFEIKKVNLTQSYGKVQWYFLVTLQLIDAIHEKDFEGKGIAAGSKVEKLQSKVILADFFDVVYPEYFHSLWNQSRMNPNWHTPIIVPGG